MTVVYVSNYMNHHQLPLCLELYRILGSDFKFIALTDVSQERISLGYSDMNDKYDFIISASCEGMDSEIIRQICESCDILLVGSAPDSIFYRRLLSGKPTIKCSERYFKNKNNIFNWFLNILTALRHIRKYQKMPLYYLCASAYTASDVNKYADFRGRTFKWGYFPKIKKYGDINSILNAKKQRSILWVARYLELKHPEEAIYVAEKLKKDGYDFTLEMVGNGPLYDDISRKIKEKSLEDCVKQVGALPTNEVLIRMEESQVFLFTSDKREGWGAVLNESMGKACAVVSNINAGSTPYLIEDGTNGFFYDRPSQLYTIVKQLLDDDKLRERVSKEAYVTMSELWSPENAASRLLDLCNAIIANKDLGLFEEGPCSRA